MKPGLLILIPTLAAAGWGWSNNWEAWEMRLMQFWGLDWTRDNRTHELAWIADPTPSLLQVPTPSSDEPPVITKELDGSIYGPGQLSLLYVPGIDPPNVWEEEDAASIKTHALDLPSGLMHVYSPGLFTGASWGRRTPWGPWLLLGSDSKSSRKVEFMPSWWNNHRVPSDIRTSLFDRVTLDEPLSPPFDASRFFLLEGFLKPFSPP